MPTATKTASNKPRTPFGRPGWPWNHVPRAGIPTRTRCQSIVTQEEAEAGAKLISSVREQEAIAAEHDIAGKTYKLNQSVRIPTMSAVEQEQLRREIAKCDHEKYLAAEDKLRDLRQEAFELAKTLLSRQIESLNSELNENAIASERRLDTAGLSIKDGAEWMLHDDAICCALWSQRHITEKTLNALAPDSAVGAVQFWCSDEPGVPFQFAS